MCCNFLSHCVGRTFLRHYLISWRMADESSILEAVNQRNGEVDALLQQRKTAEAVQKSLENPPFGVKTQDIKVKG